MSLFDSASLVVTPNGQKAGKLYSIKPSDGSGDLIVTRATSATRVDANGLVEIPRTNLATYSEDFTNSNWTKVATTISSNATTAPNGTLTADKLIPSSANSSHIIYQNIGSIGDVRMLSCYVKKIDYRYVTLQYGTASCRFDFDTLTFTGGTNNGYEALPNGWYRIYTTLTATINARFNIFIPDNSGNVSYIGDGTSGTFIWGAMAQEGNVATEYIPTIASIRTKFAGITQDGSSASNIPRLDYTNGSCPSILVEPQRTNLALRSEEFNVSPWSNLGTITITPNATTSPSGNLTADLILGADSTSNVNQIIAGTIGVVYTNSFYIKNNNSTQSQVLVRNSTSVVAANINWSGSILTSIINNAGTTTFQNVGNGWYRIISTYTAVEAPQRPRIYPTLNTNQSVYVWGWQLEAGANATSYIPTTTASVTRNADVISKTGISSLIGQTEGTLFVDFYNQLLNSTLLCINKNATNAIFINISNTGTIIGRYYANSILTTTNATTYTTFNQRIKVALKYGSFGIKLFVNGVLKGTNSTSIAFTSSLSDIFLNDGVIININEKIINNNVQVYKTALTDDECINLTTI
jgi:hypothetical protein